MINFIRIWLYIVRHHAEPSKYVVLNCFHLYTMNPKYYQKQGQKIVKIKNSTEVRNNLTFLCLRVRWTGMLRKGFA